MDNDWLTTWLQNLNLSEYWSNFAEMGYDSCEQCLSIDKQELKRIGVSKVGHLNRLFRAVEKLKSDAGLCPSGVHSNETLPRTHSPSELAELSDSMEQSGAHLAPSTSTGGRTSTGNPPPIPVRRSVRRKTPSPSDSPSPSPIPQENSNESGLQQHDTSSNRDAPPPPVLPRQHSLRRTGPKPYIDARIRASTGVSSSMYKPGHAQLSPIPQSPAPSSSTNEPQFPTTHQHVKETATMENHEDHSGSHNPPLSPHKVDRTSPKVSPRPRHRTIKDRPSMNSVPPSPPPRKSSGGTRSPIEDEMALQASQPSDGIGGGDNRSHRPSPSPEREVAPALPPKTKKFQKRIIVPDDAVVFELEDVPMPPTPGVLNGPTPLPPLPPKDAGVPNFTPPPPEALRNHNDTTYSPNDVVPPSLVPPMPPKRSSPDPIRHTSVRGGAPPPPPPRSSTLQAATLPSLPPKDPGVPQFKPSPLPIKMDADILPSPSPSPRSAPPVPPKEHYFPPPPPPITDEDFPEEDEDSEEDREGTPLISISSTSGSVKDDILLLGKFSHEDRPPSGDSEPCSPEHVSTLIRQQNVGSRLDSIIIVSPSLDDADYENQDAIDGSIAGVDSDYINQDVIDGSIAETDIDYANQDTIDERVMIRGTKPIRNTLESDTDRDYENQEVVDEDIIPFGSLPPESKRFSRQGGVDSFTAFRNCENHGSPSQDITPDQMSLTPTDDEEDFGGHNKHQSHSLPRTTNAHTASTHPVAKPRSKTTLAANEESSAQNVGGNGACSNAQYLGLNSVYSAIGDVIDPQERLLASSAPKSSRDYFDAPSQHQLMRSAGTFAGVKSERKAPTYRKMPSLGSVVEDSATLVGSISPLYSRLGSNSLSDIPKTKEGYLHKKGGKKSERPWQRRWVTFDGSELKYFKNQGDKESFSLNTVKLGEMIDIKKVNDQEKDRFDLVVINRVFQFFADSPQECQAWVNVLHAAISRFRPQDHEFKEGGSMHAPDKQGFLLKQGHGMTKGFKERYVALKGAKFAYYECKDDYVHGRPIHILEMSLTSVRPDSSGKCRFIVQMTTQKSYVFQAANEQERREWLELLTNAILTGLDTRPQTISRPGSKRTTSSDVLSKIQTNPANKKCADCAASDPSWGVVNLGIMVCINCSGVHRAMGTHISKVRSIELDQHIWTDTLIQLMVTIGNDNSNSLWEKHFVGERLPADVERVIREDFIRAKYQTKSWIIRSTGESQETLNKLLCVSVATDNLMRTVELLAHGANPCYILPDAKHPEANYALAIARMEEKDLQVELLEHNGALVCSVDQEPTIPEVVCKRGHLYKTGSDRTGWKRRYCVLDPYKGFEYFKSETESDQLGHIKMEEMLSASICEDESSKDPKYQFCFEVNTQGRGYLFCAESQEELAEWVAAFKQLITSDAADRLGYDKTGYLLKRDPHNVGGWKRRWFTLKGKKLAYYRREREELSEVDLKKVMELKGPDPSGNQEAQSSFQIVLEERIYHLRADTPHEAESWFSFLKHTQVSGIPLMEQQLTDNGLPILVHKCLQFIESYGMEIEGLYRLSGVKAKIRSLILAFNQDARGMQIDPEDYTVHDVTGTLKQFFRSLPDPLMTHQFYSAFIAAVQTSDHEQQLYQIQFLIEKLPEVNRETLKRVTGHLRKVMEHESKNKMGLMNLVRLFGPTLMTVDDDPVSFANTQYEYQCIQIMIRYYKWLFQVDEAEEKKEEAIESAVQKIRDAELKQKSSTMMSAATDFLTTVYIGNKEGDTYGTKITGVTTVANVVERVATQKGLPPANYALYLVLGDSESHRVLSFSERLLAVLCSTGSSDNFLCLKPNTFADTLGQYMNQGDVESVCLHVREKKKWKKYQCSIRGCYFVQYKDSKLHHEMCRLAVNEFDVFAGIERSKIDIKNPLPTRYCFWLKAMRAEEQSKYLCADTEQDMLRMMAGIVKAKYPDGLQTPVLPTRPPQPELEPPLRGLLPGQSPRGSPRNSPITSRKDYGESVYSNVKCSGRPR